MPFDLRLKKSKHTGLTVHSLKLSIFQLRSEFFQEKCSTLSFVFCRFGLNVILITEVVADSINMDLFYVLGVEQIFPFDLTRHHSFN